MDLGIQGRKAIVCASSQGLGYACALALAAEGFDTARQEFMAQRLMAEQGIDRATARQQIADTLPARRLGQPHEFGATCAFVCAAHAGFKTGQNLQLDGGAYAGLV